MNESLEFLLKYRTKGALFDANLLLVYIVGKTDRKFLSQFQHTKQYEPDFPLIEGLIEFFPLIYTTPNVLTEVSNLGRKLGSDFFKTLQTAVAVLEEKYCTSRNASANINFRKLGLTDAGLIFLAEGCLIITADYPLYSVLRHNQFDAVNFNHLRPCGWDNHSAFLR